MAQARHRGTKEMQKENNIDFSVYSASLWGRGSYRL
jgi:hypothetical protein